MTAHDRHSQRGVALMLLLMLIGVGALAVFVTGLNRASQQNERDRVTAAALAQAKEALIGYAVSVVNLSTGTRPGDLPCPNQVNNGIAETICGNASGSTGQNLRLGRLPWKSLGLPDLRDSYGERLWYAVSNNFKKNTRTSTLNSDTNGTITVRNADGSIRYDSSASNGVVAVIIAPGEGITRQDGLQQDRTAANINSPLHYLDNIMSEDNADFDETVTLTNGFFNGIVRDANGAVIANDRLIAITRDEIMAAIEKRVAQEVFNCLKDYALDPLNQGRLPWAAALNPAASPSYDDVSGSRFGRLPDTFNNTVIDSGASPMKNGWTTLCKLNVGTWWSNWRELVFYAVADAYKPTSMPLPSCGLCLAVNPPSVAADKSFVVVVARRSLPGGGQSRTTNAQKGAIANYLESQNATPLDDLFEQNSTTATFNDATLFAP